MPRADNCEPQVTNALLKAGWRVIKRNLYLRTGQLGTYYFADLQLEDIATGEKIIVIEVKCFPKYPAVNDEFFRVLGQYQLYQRALIKNQHSFPLYLSIPKHVYEILMQNEIVKEVIEELRIKRIIVDIDKEEVVEWIH